jgi:hypothetical protein
MNPPAGWHPDPYDPAIDRYWDGTQWTGHTRPKDTDPATQVFDTAAFTPVAGANGTAGDDAATQMIRSGNDFGEPADHPGKKKPKWPWIVGGVLVAFIGIGAIGAATEKDEAESVPTATTTTAAPSTTMSRATTTMSVAPLVPKSTKAPRPTTTPPLATTTVAPAPTTRSLEYSCSDATWREAMGAEGDELCGAPWKPRTTVPQQPAYTPPPAPAPAYTPPAPQQSSGTVHPGAYCATPGATGVTTKGTPMVCVGEGGGKGRWKSAG